jgi:hypothetical protein
VLGRSRTDRERAPDRVLWSASEHLVVEAHVTAPARRRVVQKMGLLVVLATCFAVLAYLLTRPPGPALVSAGAAPTPGAWLHRYDERVHRAWKLVTVSEYHASVASLEVSTGHRRVVITLYKQAGLWKAAREQNTPDRQASFTSP